MNGSKVPTEETRADGVSNVCFELSGRGVGDADALAKRDFVFVVGGIEY